MAANNDEPEPPDSAADTTRDQVVEGSEARAGAESDAAADGTEAEADRAVDGTEAGLPDAAGGTGEGAVDGAAAESEDSRDTSQRVVRDPSLSDHEAHELSHRPTALDAKPVTGRVTLKRATLTTPRAAMDSVSPTSSGSEAYVGCVIDGRYEVESIIGEGGMGVVYRSRHIVIGRTVAIKVLLPSFAADHEATERFLIEAQAATAIGNAHIVDVIDFGELPDGSTFFVMEFLEGESLARALRGGQAMERERRLDIGVQLAEGLAAAHEAGVVHRDLKPDNIFLTERDGRKDFVKIVDFGIAKVARSQNKITRAGTVFGTPHYMSPEQAKGSNDIDERSDVYSMGVILYELAAGHVPFDAENPMGLLTQHMYTAPTPLHKREDAGAEVSLAFDAVVLKCLRKDPDERYASMQELLADLQRLERGEAPAALEQLGEWSDELGVAPATIRRATMTPRQRRTRIVGVAVFATIAGAVAVPALFGERIRVSPESAPSASTSAPVVRSASVPSRRLSRARRVAVVVSPIDAEIFSGSRNLGVMPVTVNIRPGKTRTLVVRRDGFRSKTIKLDGSKRRVVVRLVRIPGVEPKVPVPEGGPPASLPDASVADAGPTVGPATPDAAPGPSIAPSAGPPPAPSTSAASPPPKPSTAPPASS